MWTTTIFCRRKQLLRPKDLELCKPESVGSDPNSMKLLPYSFGKRLLATALVGLLLLCATDHQVEGLSPRSRVAVGSNSTLKYWSGHHHRGRWQGSTKLNVARTDRTIMTITKLLRGGGFSLTTSVGNLIKNVGESKTKCWIALILSILGETFSTSLNKYAKQTGSVRLFFMASSLYLLT